MKKAYLGLVVAAGLILLFSGGVSARSASKLKSCSTEKAARGFSQTERAQVPNNRAARHCFPSHRAPEITGDIYVDAGNTGYEDGSEEYPFNTIQEGVDATPDGRTCVVIGEYEGSRIIYSASTGETFPILIEGRNGITLQGENYPVIKNGSIELQCSNDCTVEGIEITTRYIGISVCAYRYPYESTNVRILNNRIRIEGRPGSREQKVRGVIIEPSRLVEPSVYECYIEGNEIVTDVGILVRDVLEGSPGPETAVTIRDNLIWGGVVGIELWTKGNFIERNLIWKNKCGISLKDHANIISNNTLVFNPTGILFNCGLLTGHGDPRGTDAIVNNIVYWGIRGMDVRDTYVAGFASWEDIFRNNDIWDSVVNYSGMPDLSASGAGENISADPIFVDLAHKNCNLQLGSPCIDAGTDDIDGDGAPDITDYHGAAPDIGAFEFRP